MMESRPPREVVRQHIDRDRRQTQKHGDPEQRRMMNAPPVAAPNRLWRASMMIFLIYQARFGSQLSPGFTPMSDAMRRTNASMTTARKRVSAALNRPTPRRPGTAAFATKTTTSIH